MIAGEDADWHVYIVRCADGSLYTGIAKNVESRVSQHNEGTGARYTRGRRPVTLVYRESARERGAALRREHMIKRMSRVEKNRLIGERTGVARAIGPLDARSAELREEMDRESE